MRMRRKPRLGAVPVGGARNSMRGPLEEDWARVPVTCDCSSIDMQYFICLGSQEGGSRPGREGVRTGCPLRPLPRLRSRGAAGGNSTMELAGSFSPTPPKRCSAGNPTLFFGMLSPALSQQVQDPSGSRKI